MMMVKRVLSPNRLRRVPRRFSWVDQRLAREKILARCTGEAWVLYLFLLCVGDAQGLSYYSDRKVGHLLGWEFEEVLRARAQLLREGLIAYEAPLYQVLSLERAQEEPKEEALRRGEVASRGEILNGLANGRGTA